ncbi:hypothetical protein GcM1_218010 [Golovinomyces cichoracearum]|uniref:CCHC-type domain-containing protein n=1 Tax=Golovinomyces cichoracearum TaxID=62708 RepID=A0A420ISL3_9PEZI|nr:hypothetical protein GcM1_218010 [Golovinomyces cichoracearum]
MVGINEVDMEDEVPFYKTPDSQPQASSATEPAPSWVSLIVRLLSQLISSQSSRQAPSFDQKPGHSQPHSEKFSGSDLSLFPQFRSILKAILQMDAKAIGNEAERVWYGFGLDGFLNRLDKAFGDTDKITKAIQKLNIIRQGNRDFRDFLQDFEQTVLEAQGWGWEDPNKKGHLRTALNRELSDSLVSQDEPDSYDDFVSQLRKTSDKIEVMKSWNERKHRNRYLPQQTLQTLDNENGDPIDWEPTQTVSFATAQRNLRVQLPSSESNRAIWVSNEEIGRRVAAGLCLRCGKRGHRIRDCNLLPALNPNRKDKNSVSIQKNQQPQFRLEESSIM